MDGTHMSMRKTKNGITVSINVEEISNGYLVVKEIHGDVENEMGEKKWFNKTVKKYYKNLPPELKPLKTALKDDPSKMLSDKFK